MPDLYKVVTYERGLDGFLTVIAEQREPTAAAAMSRAGELSRIAEGTLVVALLQDGETEILARYGNTPPEPPAGVG